MNKMSEEAKRKIELVPTLDELMDRIKEKYKDRYPNPNLLPRLEKVTINYSGGPDATKLERARKILESIFKRKPAQVRARKTVHVWGVRKGRAHGWKITLRGEEAYQWLKTLLKVVDYTIYEKQLDNHGNFSFGIKEHIDIPGVKYVPELGTIGFDVTVTFYRNGYRVARRRLRKSKIPEKHRVKKEDVILFLKEMGVIVKPGSRPKEE